LDISKIVSVYYNFCKKKKKNNVYIKLK
jgi:hypothetical protein